MAEDFFCRPNIIRAKDVIRRFGYPDQVFIGSSAHKNEGHTTGDVFLGAEITGINSFPYKGGLGFRSESIIPARADEGHPCSSPCRRQGLIRTLATMKSREFPAQDRFTWLRPPGAH